MLNARRNGHHQLLTKANQELTHIDKRLTERTRSDRRCHANEQHQDLGQGHTTERAYRQEVLRRPPAASARCAATPPPLSQCLNALRSALEGLSDVAGSSSPATKN